MFSAMQPTGSGQCGPDITMLTILALVVGRLWWKACFGLTNRLEHHHRYIKFLGVELRFPWPLLRYTQY